MSFTLTLEIPISRRKRVHQIRDESGKERATHQNVSDCFQWLYDNDIRRVELITPAGQFYVDFDKAPWQD